MSEAGVYEAQCEYFCRHGLYHSARMTAAEAAKNSPVGGAVFRLWQAMATALEGQWQEAMRQLQRFEESDTEHLLLPVVLVRLFCHQMCRPPDNSAISELNERKRQLRKQSSVSAWQYAATFMMFAGLTDKAREYLQRAVKLAGSQVQAGVCVTRAWLQLETGGSVADAEKWLDQASSADDHQHRLLAMLQCRARCALLHNDFSTAHTHLSSLLVARPSYVPALEDKMRVCLAQHDWSQSVELAERVTAAAPQYVHALLVQVLAVLARDGDMQLARERLDQLRAACERYEPCNVQLLLMCSRVVSRTCARSDVMLDGVMQLCQLAQRLDDSQLDVHVELGHVHLLRGNTILALASYRTAARLDAGSLAVMVGVAWCQLLDDQLQAASDSVHFLVETVEAASSAAHHQCRSHMLLLVAVLAARQRRDHQHVLERLAQFVDTHFRSLRTLTLGVEYLTLLNVDLLLLAAEECLKLAPSTTSASPSASPSPVWDMTAASNCPPPSLASPHSSHKCLQLASSILEPLVKTCPAVMKAQYLLARTYYLQGERHAALDILRDKCRINHATATSSNQAYLLLAQIFIDIGSFGQAEQSLEKGLSDNFAIKQHPLYHFVLARVHKQKRYWQAATTCLITSLSLCDIAAPQAISSETVDASAPSNTSRADHMQSADVLSVMLELTDVYRASGQCDLARNTLDQAAARFAADHTHHQRVLIAAAQLRLTDGDIAGALASLRAITADQPLYVQSRQKMADIYLRHLVDRRMYAACYRDIVEQEPSASTYAMLGDAYVTILDPDKAIEVYEAALKRTPRDHVLTLKMGRALVKTHQYDRAVSYYRSAIRMATAASHHDHEASCTSLLYDLAFLLVRTRQYDKAEKTVRQALQRLPTNITERPADATMAARLLQLQSKIDQLVSGQSAAIGTLQRAYDAQCRVLTLARAAHCEGLADERRRTALVACGLAAGLHVQQQHERAVQLYKQAAQLDEECDNDDAAVLPGDDSGALMSLAQLLDQMGRVDECRRTCEQMLRRKPDHQAAVLMTASLSMRSGGLDQAELHYRQALRRQPDCWRAVAGLIQVLRRRGCLHEAAALLSQAAAVTDNSVNAALSFCRGLWLQYSSKTDAALNSFNLARGDDEWGAPALLHMIYLCLYQHMVGVGDLLVGEGDGRLSNTSATSSGPPPLQTAETLLSELEETCNLRVTGSRKADMLLCHRLLSNWCLLASRNKSSVQQALQEFSAMCQPADGVGIVSAVFGAAAAHVLLKQLVKARALLQSVVEDENGRHESYYCDYTEHCRLLLAALHIQTGKHAPAVELLQRVVSENRSCVRAHERLAAVRERENCPLDAAHHYQLAWDLSASAIHPDLGYKLAFNYLKAKQYVRSIQVCRQVMKTHPNHSKIRKDILEKARSQLKV